MSVASVEKFRRPETQLRQEADLQDHEIDLRRSEVMLIDDAQGHGLVLRRLNNTQVYATEISGEIKRRLGRVRLEDDIDHHHRIGTGTVWVMPLGLTPDRAERTFRVSVPPNFTVTKP